MELDKKDMQYWLCRFVLEVRTKKGTEYAPNTLYHLICGTMRYVRTTVWKTRDSKDPEFSQFRSSLNAEMKRLQATGLGSTRKQAEPFSMQEEELLWEKNLLGDHCPSWSLLNTMVFMNGLYFALRSGSEHRQLRHNPCQIDNPHVHRRHLKEPPRGAKRPQTQAKSSTSSLKCWKSIKMLCTTVPDVQYCLPTWTPQ